MKRYSAIENSNHAENQEDLDFYLSPGEDPITRLGFGLTNYFEMIKIFAITMLVMTLINIPLYAVYSHY